MNTDHLLLAFRSLVRRKLRSWLTMIGIFIGIAAVVSLIGLGEGLRVAITSQFGFLGPDVLSVQASGLNFAGPPGTASPNPLKDDLPDKLSRITGVEAAFGRYIASGTLEFADKKGFSMIGSVPSGTDRSVFERVTNLNAVQGRLLKDSDHARIVVGNNFMKQDNGFDRPVQIGDRLLLNKKPFEVVGILESKGSFIFDDIVLMNEDDILDGFRKDDGTMNLIAIKVKNIEDVDKVSEGAEKLLRKERDVKKGEEDFVVESPEKTLESLNSTLFAVQLFVYIIASISLLVGGIGIMNTMYTSVLERTKEIGIMKSIGAKNKTIFSLFAIESGLLGTVGGIIGILLGLAISNGFAAVGKLALGTDLIRVETSPFLLIGALLFSFCIGFAAGVFPAMRAASLKPVDALRS